MADSISKESTIQQVREEWSKYNEDRASKIAFGEAESPDMDFARNIAKTRAVGAFGKKQNTENYTVQGAVIKDEKTYSNPNNTYSSLMLVEVDAIIPDEAVVQKDTGGNSAILDDQAGTLITGYTEAGADIEYSDHFSAQVTVQGKATKNGKTYTATGYAFTTKDTEVIQREVWGRVYDEIARNISADDASTDSTISGKYPHGYKTKTVSFKFTPVGADRPKEKPAPPPPPPAAPPPPPDSKEGVYYPKSKQTKAQAAGPQEFVYKDTGEYHSGQYVKTSDNKYYAGSTTMETGRELEKVKSHANRVDEGLPKTFGILIDALGGLFRRKPTKSEMQNGVLKRYFVQDKNTGKIVETDKSTFDLTQQQVLNKGFAQAEWNLNGPAEDKMINGYPFEGAASKNKKAIQALEKQMPGISNFVTDYAYLVQEPVYVQKAPMAETQTFIDEDPTAQLRRDRKASFDNRK